MATQGLTQVEFQGEDFFIAAEIARRLGYQQHAYTSTSDLWGVFCLGENPERAKPGQATRNGVIIKTLELGFLFVQDLEDLRMGDLGTFEQHRREDPHCTCNDCLAFHEAQQEQARREE